MFTSMNRPYKVDNPQHTIIRIRNILAEMDCLVYETRWSTPYRGVHSVRIETDVCDGSFGTNGKGRDKLYCLASAYAEFIERLQNGMLSGRSFSRLFLRHVKKETGYYYFPDETIITREQFEALPEDYLGDVFSDSTRITSVETYFARLKENGYPGCIAVPFYDMRRNRVVHLPHNITQTMSGSNGMAAGNSVAEGVFQGLCELLERYGASQVYHNRLTPPTIPRQYLQQYPGEYEIIRQIEEDGKFEVIVKDFSANVRLPALGVMIRHRHKNTYRLNVGCDTSFAVALSRCLTEIYQGKHTVEDTEKSMLPIPETEHSYFLKDDEESIRLRTEQLLKFTINGMGVFPRSLFETSESYAFDPTVFTTYDSYEDEVRHLVTSLLDAGHNIYVRDVSFLGFPSFFIYMPKVSTVGKKTESMGRKIDFEELATLDRVEDLFFPFKGCSSERLLQLANTLDTPADPPLRLRLKLEFSGRKDWNDIPCSFLLTMVWYQLHRYEDAVRNLRRFMKGASLEDELYFKTVLAFLEGKAAGMTDDDVRTSLSGSGSPSTMVDEIMAGFSSDEHLYDAIGIPACPGCDECPVAEGCLTRNKLSFTKRINLAMRKTNISQEQFGVFAAGVAPAQ